MPIYLPRVLQGRFVMREGRAEPNLMMRVSRHLHIGRVGFCPCCATFSTTIEDRPRNTRYVDEPSNWLLSCEDCKQEDDAYWNERWADYYGGVL